MTRQKSLWTKVVLGVVLVVFCFVPLVPMSYEVVAQKQVMEEYTTVEPYTVQEEVLEPYRSIEERVYWQESEAYREWRTSIKTSIEDAALPDSPSGRWVTENRWVTKYRTVTKDVTKYREVTKTRLVYHPVVETQTKRVSILRYLLR